MVLDEGWIEGQRSKEAHRFYEFAPRDRYFNEGPLDEEWNDIWPLNIYENWIWKAWEKEGGGEGAKANTTNKEHTQHNPFSLLLIIAKFFFSFFRSSVSVFGSNCLWFESWTQSRAPFGSETSEFELIFCWICSWLLLLLLSIIGERSEWNFDFFFLKLLFWWGKVKLRGVMALPRILCQTTSLRMPCCRSMFPPRSSRGSSISPISVGCRRRRSRRWFCHCRLLLLSGLGEFF